MGWKFLGRKISTVQNASSWSTGRQPLFLPPLASSGDKRTSLEGKGCLAKGGKAFIENGFRSK